MKKLVLIGYMGAGKSTIGKQLSKELDVPFFDTDTYIEEKEGRKIADIFAEEGEDYFRNLETKCLRELLEREENGILSTGGGLPLREENRKLLKQMGDTVYLQVSKETVLKRLQDDKTRPLLQGKDKEVKIEQMLKTRHPIYQETADFSVVTDGKSIHAITEEILKQRQNCGIYEKNS